VYRRGTGKGMVSWPESEPRQVSVFRDMKTGFGSLSEKRAGRRAFV